MTAEPVIVAKDLVKYYKEHGFYGKPRLALDKISLEVRKGETVALLGPNGAGKTSLLRILFGLILPSGGEATVFNAPCSEVSWKNRAGYVPEFFTPPKFLTGGELLEMGSQGMSRSDFEKKVDWLNQAIGLKDAMDIRIGRLPRGSIHQLGLAQALVHDPELLVLDEPSANLDAISRKKLKNLLIEFAAKGKTVLISSHILSEVEELCTRVIFINKGKVVQQGKTEDLLGTGGGYLIRFKTPAEMPSQLSRLGSVVPDPEAGVTAFETRTDTEKDLVVKALVENGIAIQSLELRQKTLEEVFMELLEERMLENYLTKIMAT